MLERPKVLTTSVALTLALAALLLSIPSLAMDTTARFDRLFECYSGTVDTVENCPVGGIVLRISILLSFLSLVGALGAILLVPLSIFMAGISLFKLVRNYKKSFLWFSALVFAVATLLIQAGPAWLAFGLILDLLRYGY
jgi:hypothetical protein